MTGAFAPRRHLRELLSPHPNRLAPIDGLRAISLLWVLAFHAGWYSIRWISSERYVELLRAAWMLPIWRGDFAVDVFFVLSGFLIAGLLIDERERTGRVRLGLFYLRRLLRLWPALAVALGIDLLVLDESPTMAWAGLLYVSNFVPVWRVTMAWTWSLSIEEQFYLVCPWLLRALAGWSPRVRVLALLALMAALAGVAVLVIVGHGFHPRDAEIVVTRPPPQWNPAFDNLYSKPWMRAGPLLSGMLAAVLYRARRVMDAFARHAFASTAALVLSLVLAADCTRWPLVDGGPRWIEVAYLAAFRPLFGLSVAYAVLFTLSSHPLGRVLARVLSARALYPLAQLAYCAYLMNPIIAMRAHPLLATWVARVGIQPMLVFIPVDLVGTLAAALVLHVLVERPFMDLRPRVPGVTGSR